MRTGQKICWNCVTPSGPYPRDDEVLVEMRAAGVGPEVWHLMTGRPYVARAALGLRKPENPVRGWDGAGRVEARTSRWLDAEGWEPEHRLHSGKVQVAVFPLDPDRSPAGVVDGEVTASGAQHDHAVLGKCGGCRLLPALDSDDAAHVSARVPRFSRSFTLRGDARG